MAKTEPSSWRGMFQEEQMTEADIIQRAGEQARAMLHAGDPFISSPNEDGEPTGGLYNMDYPDEYHAAQNERLSTDPFFASKVAGDLRKLANS